MIKETETTLKREMYYPPKSMIIFFSQENKVMTSSGEDAGDEENPGF